MITKEQFWEGRDGLVELGVAQQAQKMGKASAFGLEVPKVEKVRGDLQRFRRISKIRNLFCPQT